MSSIGHGKVHNMSIIPVQTFYAGISLCFTGCCTDFTYMLLKTCISELLELKFLYHIKKVYIQDLI